MDIVKFMYEHWVLTSWFLLLFRGASLIRFTQRVRRNYGRPSDRS